ncbi:hypothetical protein BUALT_Bualt05G0089400 [Buddleja alternifolia]|uniref:LRAT domain-containing protein n=1 Tax=Buddleja alternifolia TaxID=168488 RepID=A0AAV6XJ83_9LAMI|nr:hypothetical protein BUALT_Bualt05G0089400 [Buddleja alternifolia]
MLVDDGESNEHEKERVEVGDSDDIETIGTMGYDTNFGTKETSNEIVFPSFDTVKRKLCEENDKGKKKIMEPWDIRACASIEPWDISNCSLICSNSFDNKDNIEYENEVPCRTSMCTGRKFIEEILKGHGIRGMSVYEELGIFLMACAHNVDNRLLQEDCIRAIDGTHVKARLPQGKAIPYIGRKGFSSQYILAVVDFNMCFTFAWAVWEGVAHDNRIFGEAICRLDLNFPRVEARDLEAGDHIYSWRTAFAYSHHGIYVGENKVVHFTRDQLSSSDHSSFAHFSSSASDVPTACLYIPHCASTKHESGVIISCLNCFLGHGSLYRFEYGVSRLTLIAKLRGGTCTTAKSNPPEDVILMAMYLLHNGFGNYALFTNNCEDFALYCKTGYIVRGRGEATGASGQASSFKGAPLAAIVSLPLRLLVSSPIGIVTASAVYTYNKYAADIGVRDDVKKVKIEDIALFLRSHLGDKVKTF